ncbi:SAM-dependent DNA methyltransferase [Pantoea sp. Acro-835]|uniref:SAM-dependent DNA methyltransferase n=1 Tax=Candidatus Pantoea multigeneris TaxID=2608357 RepID=A0ABX0RFB2_9GAMM|nr:SAM-dependent DNA methyltransferase [Pantoea multigeneris]
MAQMDFDSLFFPEESTVTPAKRMRRPEEARREFLKVFSTTAHAHHRRDVFRDFVNLAARELDLCRVRSPENIREAKAICDRYRPEDMQAVSTLFNLMVEAMGGPLDDFLGGVFMELELGSDAMAQYFTPFHVSQLLAGLSYAREPAGNIVMLHEPSCGAGGMILAYAEQLETRGLNYQEMLFAHCIDIDALAADMCFVQLSLRGIAAEVVTGNTLTLEAWQVRHTPVYHLGEWAKRLDQLKRLDRIKALLQVA